MKSTLGLVGACLFLTQSISASIVTTLDKNDPLPTYNSSFPYAYLASREKEFIKGKLYVKDPNYISFSTELFYQKADKGTNDCGETVQLGDLTGRWNMVSLLPYNNSSSDIPTSVSGYPTVVTGIRDNLLDCIANQGISPLPSELQSTQGLLSLQPATRDLFGFFSVPIEYRKRGVRFSASARIHDIGVSVQTGVANISQCAKFYNLMLTNLDGTYCLNGPCPTNPIVTTTTGSQPLVYYLNPFPSESVTREQWGSVIDCANRDLMDKKDCIARALGIDLCDFNKTSVEDVYMEVFWRRLIAINTKKCRGGDWPSFIFMPFVAVGGSIGFADARSQNNPFSLSAGNNGHDSFRFNAGFTIDFFNSFEIGGTAGFTNFKSKEFCEFRVPNNDYQNMMYPFATRVCYSPGNTWHTSVFMNSYNYYENWSFYAEYVWATHGKDRISLLNPEDIRDLTIMAAGTCENKGFKPQVLECKSPWSVQVINTGLTWMPSPNFVIGANAQIPIQRRNAYKSTTLAASFELIY